MKGSSNILRFIAVLLLFAGVQHAAEAQKWAVSTNALSWANLGTINAEGSYGIADHFSLHAGFTANPWQLRTPTYVLVKNKQYGGFVGAKYWPWHTYSEWWIGAKLQYKNFEQQGLLTSSLTEGNAIGAGLSAGYSMMIADHVNLDFGLGLWGGRIVKQRNFIFLDNVIVAIVYVF